MKHTLNFFNIIDSVYGECFSAAKIRLKQKEHFTPWIKGGIKKLSKRKQRFYKQFLKHKTILNEEKTSNTFLNRLSGSQRKATTRKYYGTNMKKHGVTIRFQNFFGNFLLIRSILF